MFIEVPLFQETSRPEKFVIAPLLGIYEKWNNKI